GDPSATYNLGAIAANQGQADEARRHWASVRGGGDARLAEQAAASLAQRSGAGSRPARPSASPRPTNPHVAGAMGRPLVAHRTSVPAPAEGGGRADIAPGSPPAREVPPPCFCCVSSRYPPARSSSRRVS